MGKNDPYVVFSFDPEADKDQTVKTSTKKNAGTTVEWNENVTLRNYDPSRHSNLYVEVWDQEKGVDQPIGFTVIPLYQVQDAPGKSYKGRFDLYDDASKQKGTIHLTLTSRPESEATSHVTHDGPEVQGTSSLDEKAQKKIKSAHRKEQAGDAVLGAAALGLGAALLGGALGGSKKPEDD